MENGELVVHLWRTVRQVNVPLHKRVFQPSWYYHNDGRYECHNHKPLNAVPEELYALHDDILESGIELVEGRLPVELATRYQYGIDSCIFVSLLDYPKPPPFTSGGGNMGSDIWDESSDALWINPPSKTPAALVPVSRSTSVP
jgi:hypothetical protein